MTSSHAVEYKRRIIRSAVLSFAGITDPGNHNGVCLFYRKWLCDHEMAVWPSDQDGTVQAVWPGNDPRDG